MSRYDEEVWLDRIVGPISQAEVDKSYIAQPEISQW